LNYTVVYRVMTLGGDFTTYVVIVERARSRQAVIDMVSRILNVLGEVMERRDTVRGESYRRVCYVDVPQLR